MEAISIIAAKAGPRSAGPQAQSELGDIFQDLLREATRPLETPAAAHRTDSRQDRPLRRDSVFEPGSRSLDDRSGRLDDDTNEFNSVQAPAPTEPRHDFDAADDRLTVERTDETAPEPADQESQAPVATSTGVPTPDSASASGTLADAGGAEPSNSGAHTSLAGGHGGTAPAAQAAPGINPVAASATAQAQGVAAGLAPGSAVPQPPAGTPEPKPAVVAPGGQEAFVRVSVTPAPLVAPPTASLGGGAAAAAIANANPLESTGPAGSTLNPTAGAASQNATETRGQSALGLAGPQGAAANAQALPVDGQTGVAQSAGAAAAAGTVPEQTGLVTPGAAPTRGTDAAIAQGADADHPQSPNRNGSAAAGQIAGSNAGGETLEPTTAGQGGVSTTPASPNRDAPAPRQAQNGPAPNAQSQAPLPPNSPAPALQGAQTAPAQIAAQAAAAAEARSTAGSTGPADTASGPASSAAAAATGGFAQPASKVPNTFGSLSRPGTAVSAPADQVAVEIQKGLNAGKDHVRVRLHPAELGQIDVSLKVRHDGTIRAVVTADRPDTYDLLQRDARGLERALQDAGLKTDSGSLSFNLRGGEQQGPNDGQRGAESTAQAGVEPRQTAEAPPAGAEPTPPVPSSHALDIRV